MLIPFFSPSFSNSFLFLLLIILGYFNFFLPFVPNWNGPTNLWLAKDMSYWYQAYIWFFSRGFVNYLVSWQHLSKRTILILSSYFRPKMALHSRIFLRSSYCMTYHWKIYTPYFLMETGSYCSIYTCTKDHLVWFGPADTCLMKKSLSIDISMSLLRWLNYIWSSCLRILGFLSETNTTFSCSWSSGLSWYLLSLSLDP